MNEPMRLELEAAAALIVSNFEPLTDEQVMSAARILATVERAVAA